MCATAPRSSIMKESTCGGGQEEVRRGSGGGQQGVSRGSDGGLARYLGDRISPPRDPLAVTPCVLNYTRGPEGIQRYKGVGENIPVPGTNRGRGERIYPFWAPIAEEEREYTRTGHRSRKGRERLSSALALE
eukprot:421106-Pyramimonas_sp.AAC.2